ncbi:MAG TPA: hypothetical protein VHI99_31390 [Vicinamibacterales bacterium]|jgi:hypothetical protein|nr:hypothetical protein [Vicinamibacterales bacterium]
MSGRRSHSRFVVAAPWDGALRVLRDVVIDRTSRDELLAVSHVPGVAGEEMSLDLMGSGMTLALRVKVIESRPVIVDGSVRHRIRLELVQAPADLPVSSAALPTDAPTVAEAI